MAMRTLSLLAVLWMVGGLTLVGCRGGDTPAGGDSGGHAGHSHDEEELGPSGGHLIELGDEEYHLEWLHDDDEGVLTFIVLDSAAEKEVPIEGDLVLNLELTDDKGQQQQLSKTATAIGRSEESPKTAKFELADRMTTTNVTKSEGVKATVNLEIDGKPYTGEIEHHDHGHSHSH